MPEHIENRMIAEPDWSRHEREHFTCARCGAPIYREDIENYADDCYEIDGEYYCDDCIADAARDIFRVAI